MNNFDDFAEFYEQAMLQALPPERLELEAKEFMHLRNPSGWKVLDIGCGTGIQTAFLKKRFPGIQSIEGIDVSEKIITIAKREHGGEGVRYSVGDFHNLAFSDEMFDFVYSRYALHYSTDMPTAMKEIARVSKPGAYIFIHVSHPMYEMTRKPSKDYQHKEEAQFLPTPYTNLVLEHMTHTMEEYMNSMAGAGLQFLSMTERYGIRSTETEFKIPTILMLRLRKPL